jgi:hypothetical protein
LLYKKIEFKKEIQKIFLKTLSKTQKNKLLFSIEQKAPFKNKMLQFLAMKKQKI